MDKTIIVTKDPRIPYDAEGRDYEIWSRDKFIKEAQSGIDVVNLTLFINLDVLDEVLYKGIKSAIAVDTTYYKFDDQDITLNFNMDDDITQYNTKKAEPEEEPEEIPEIPKIQPNENIPNIEDDSASNTISEKLPQERDHEKPVSKIGDLDVMNAEPKEIDPNKLNTDRLGSLLEYDGNLDPGLDDAREERNAKVILFGSSKGGTGKTFTCLLSAYRYSRTHPDERIALADFDIIDGQIGITISKAAPTFSDYYKQYMAGNNDFATLFNSRVKSDKFDPNLDFYLAPPMDVPEVTNNEEFWVNVFTLLIKNYDTVFFDSGIDYLGKPPISKLYKIADKIILTSNTSINSVKSIIRQLQTISGRRKNNVFNSEMHILDRVNIVLTRVSSGNATNDLVINTLSKYAPIVAAFGNIDNLISKTQWYQQWNIWDYEDKVNASLDRITDFNV